MSIIIKREEACYVFIVRSSKLGVNLVGMLRVASQKVSLFTCAQIWLYWAVFSEKKCFFLKFQLSRI